MDKTFITQSLVERGIPRSRIEYGWLGDAGPGIHLVGTTFYALLPLDDESDAAFVDFVYAETVPEMPSLGLGDKKEIKLE